MESTAQLNTPIFCPYCGCGCRMQAEISGGRVSRITQDINDPISKGKACVKGLTSHEPLYTRRLKDPMIRPVKSRSLRTTTWDKAWDMISNKIEDLYLYDDRGIQDLVYFVADGQSTNEFNYLLSKLARSHFHTNNIDSCARLCHQATSEVFKQIWGVSAIPKWKMDDLRDVDCFLVAGSDPAENYPVMFNRIIEGKKKGAKIISVDIAQTSTTESSDDHLKIRTEMLIPFVSYLISKFVDSDKISRDAKQFHGFQDLVESAQEVSRKYPPSSYGLDKEKMTQVFQTLRDARKIGICFGMGVTQHSNGTENVKALVQLGILLNGVIFPSRGKMNVQGAGDAGGCPNWEGTDNLESFKWNIDYKNHEGRGLTDALYDRDVKFVWIAGGDPAISMPDLNLLEESFRHKFIVYQGAHSARVTKWASVVLPSAMVSEENGTFTNGERRVRGNFSNTLSKSLPDKAKSGFQIMMEFADTVGAEGFDYKNEQEVFEEIVETVPGYRGLSLEKVTSDEGQFADKSIKYTRLEKINFDMDHFRGDGVYPFTLTTSRGKFHFCTGNLSRNSKSLNQLSGEPVVYMNPLDMDFLGIEDEQKIKIISEVGEITATVEKNIDVMKRMIVAQFHFPKMLVNKLTPRVLDPHSGTPSYKQVPVKIEVLI